MPVSFAPSPSMPGDIQSAGSMLMLVGNLTFSGSYATGGDPLDLVALFKKIAEGKHIRVLGTARGNTLEYDVPNKKLKVYSSANTELAAGAYNAALTASIVPIIVVGR